MANDNRAEASWGKGSHIDADYMHPLLLHIHVYVFAECYDISGLQCYSASRAARLFRNSDLDDGSLDLVFDAMEFAFGNLPENDNFLKWLGIFAGGNLDKLKRSARLVDLMTGYEGTFAKHMLENVAPGENNKPVMSLAIGGHIKMDPYGEPVDMDSF